MRVRSSLGSIPVAGKPGRTARQGKRVCAGTDNPGSKVRDGQCRGGRPRHLGRVRVPPNAPAQADLPGGIVAFQRAFGFIAGPR